MTDLELIEAWRAGSDRAAETLLERHRPAIVAIARQYWTPLHQDHEDIVQEAMLEAFASLEGYDPRRGRTVESYLRMVLRRRLGGLVKSSRREVRSIHLEPMADVYELADTIPAVEDADPVLVLGYRDLLAAIRSELSPMEAAAVLGASVGIVGQELAELTGYSAKQLDNALRRGKARLAGVLSV